MIVLESAVLALVAGLSGLLLGVALTYGLVRGLGALLAIPALDAAFAPQALLATGVFFGLLFAVDAWLSARMMHTLTLKQLLLAPRLHQPSSVVAPARIAVGLGALALAYTLALVTGADAVVGTLSVLPIVALCGVGTYLLFDQALVWALGTLRRRVRSGVTLMLVSRLSYRVHDYARLLTVVTLLSGACSR